MRAKHRGCALRKGALLGRTYEEIPPVAHGFEYRRERDQSRAVALSGHARIQPVCTPNQIRAGSALHKVSEVRSPLVVRQGAQG